MASLSRGGAREQEAEETAKRKEAQNGIPSGRPCVDLGDTMTKGWAVWFEKPLHNLFDD